MKTEKWLDNLTLKNLRKILYKHYPLPPEIFHEAKCFIEEFFKYFQH